MISCEVISDLMVVYASGEASPETRRLVEEHLSRCSDCREAFGKERLVEEALADLTREERPANGQRFLTRTRRLLFAIGVGTLSVFACVLAGFKWVIVEGMELVSPSSMVGQGLLVLGTTLVTLMVYAFLLLWRSRRESRTQVSDILLSLAMAVPLALIVFAAFQLLSTGAMLTGFVAMSFLAFALAITFVLLPRAPYMTIAVVLVLLAVSGLLLGQTFVGSVALSDFSFQWPASLGHPPAGMTAADAVSVDMLPLGLELVESMEVTSVDNVQISPQARAVRATYEGDGRQVFLTLVESADRQEADEFFVAWKGKAGKFRIAALEINLLGQGHIMRCYDAQSGRAYSAWQTSEWVTIIEVPGPLDQAMRLAREAKDLVARSYRGQE